MKISHDQAEVPGIFSSPGFRHILVLAGKAEWGRQTVADWVADGQPARSLWLGEHPPSAWRGHTVTPARALSWLGRELDLLVFDAHDGLDPDALGALAGTPRGGGMFVWLLPELADLPVFPDPQRQRLSVFPHGPEAVGGRFLTRLAGIIRGFPRLTLIEASHHRARPLLESHGKMIRQCSETSSGTADPSAFPLTRTPDQAEAVAALVKVATGHRRRPLVLISDRGRGKSAALGLAAAELLRGGAPRVIVTAPSAEAVAPVFEQARRALPGAKHIKSALHWQQGELLFLAPDELLAHPRETRLVMVDEAAAIPAPLLQQLLKRQARIAFATTVHGYEGTGQGFALRFRQTLERETPRWRSLRLDTPIRWRAGDPLEALIFRALLLDAAPAEAEKLAEAGVENCRVSRVDRDQLLTRESELAQLFGLLITAHYRTSPLDLRHLLDGPNIRVYWLRYREQVAGVALLAEEGGFAPEIAREVWAGQRRPRGHLIPETLAAHLGRLDAPALRGLRVMRIAIHPAIQGRGLGSFLLKQLGRLAREEKAWDYLGSSFGANPGLLDFWADNAFLPIRLSARRGAASGSHSALVLCPLSSAGRALADDLRVRFLTHFPILLGDTLRELETPLARRLMQADCEPGEPPPLDDQDWQDAWAFAFARRVYEACPPPLWKLAVHALRDPAAQALLGDADSLVLVQRILQQRPWGEVAAALGLSGRAEVVALLRQTFGVLLKHYGKVKLQG